MNNSISKRGKNTIRGWKEDDRPREKLMIKGPESLSDSELLAIMIKEGTPNRSAVEVARDLLYSCGNNLNRLARLSPHDLMKIKGIGKAKAAAISAVLELGRRRAGDFSMFEYTVTSSKSLSEMLQLRFRDYNHELFTVLFLNNANRVIRIETISKGGISATTVDARLLLQKAIMENAVKLILCHNHPSGNLRPSETDRRMTSQIKVICEQAGIDVLDHIIVGVDGYYSFADHGLIQGN